MDSTTTLRNIAFTLIGLSLVFVWMLLWLFPVGFGFKTWFGLVHPIVPLLAMYVSFLALVALGQLGLRIEYVVGLAVMGLSLIILLYLLAQALAQLPAYRKVWDDSFMFYRYAYNLRSHSQIAWNIADGPAYGSTEGLHLLAVWALTFSQGLDAPHRVLQLASFAGGVTMLALITILVLHVTKLPIIGRMGVLLLIALSLVNQSDNLSEHFITGMGTTWTMAYLCVYLLLAYQHLRSPKRWSLIATGVMGGLGYVARPDLVVFPLCLALIWAVNPSTRRDGLRMLALTIVTILVLMLAAFLYFGSPVPLSFFAKSTTGLYGEGASIYDLREPIAAEQLDIFLHSNRLLLAIIVIGWLRPRRLWERYGVLVPGILLGVAVYVAYYRFVALQIMFMNQRFYYPVLPPLILLAACSLSVTMEPPLHLVRTRLEQSIRFRSAGVLAIIGTLVLLFYPWDDTIDDIDEYMLRERVVFYQPEHSEYTQYAAGNWSGIDHFSLIADDFVVATTEVGLPSIANMNWYVYDLAGLNQTDLAMNGFSADVLFNEVQPDLIYMPFIDYDLLYFSIREHPVYQRDYRYYEGYQVNGNLPIAINTRSRYYDEMQAIVDTLSQD